MHAPTRNFCERVFTCISTNQQQSRIVHKNQKYNMFNWDEKNVDYQTLGKTTVPMSEERMNEKKMEYAWDEFTHDFAIPENILIVLYGQPSLRYHDF